MSCRTCQFWKKHLCLVFFLVIYVSSVNSQTYVVSRYADDNGLPSRIVRDVIQDSRGFIWVAGNNGLYKFDGQYFRPFLASLKDTVGLRDNKITSLFEGNDGKLWVGTPKGLHFLNGNELEYYPLIKKGSREEEYIINVFGDDRGNLWISTYGGVFLLDSSGEPKHFLSDNNEIAISKGTVWSVNQDNNNTIWASTNNGLFTQSKDNPYSFERVPLKFESSIVDTDIGYYRVQQYDDELFILDTNHGLLKGVFREGKLHLSYFVNSQGQFEKGYPVERSIIDKEGSIWLATWKNYFKKFKIENGNLIEQEVLSKNGFLGFTDTSHSVFEDLQGNIWFANANGLYKFSEDTSHVTTFPPFNCLEEFSEVYGITEDYFNNVWITTPSKLYRFKKEDILNNKCPTAYFEWQEEGMEQARDIMIDAQNRLWLGADGGLFVTQLDSNQNPGKFVRFTTKDGLPHHRNYEVLQETKNTFWVGNYHGLLRLKLRENNLKIDSLNLFTAKKGSSSRLVNTQAMNLELDGNDDLWIGTFSGLSRLVDDSAQGIFENYTTIYGNEKTISNNSVKKVFKDVQGRIWVATQRGLNLYEPESNTFLQFGHAEGLPSEYVLGIAQDSQEFYWICTTNGVLKARYDENSQTFVERLHYTINDGLADNIPYRNSIYIDDEDNVLVGSRDGISIIRKDVENGMYEQQSSLTLLDFKVNTKNEDGFQSVLDQLNEEQLILDYNTNSLKLNYVILDFINPKNNTYRHKLLPVNDAWIDTGGLSELVYYNLPPDEYTLVLDAANNRGQWTNNPVELKVLIKPPFWKTNWAIVGYIILLTLLIWTFYRMRIRKKEREWTQKLAFEKAITMEREQLRKENAADFHDELGSMLTKISMFLTMAERSMDGDKDPKPFFLKIRENTKGLSRGFRDLLWVIDPQKDSLADTFLRLKEFGEDLFEQSSIDFSTSEFQDDFVKSTLNPKTKKQLVMIFKEAMNNCLKYSNAKHASLTLTFNDKFSKMEFVDNGDGFDVNKKSKGRGLKNMIARANSIDAKLSLVSSSEGSSIILDRIPHMSDNFYDKET